MAKKNIKNQLPKKFKITKKKKFKKKIQKIKKLKRKEYFYIQDDDQFPEVVFGGVFEIEEAELSLEFDL